MSANGMQGTPRTDALEAEFPLRHGGYIFDLARQLERELSNEQACTKAMNEDFHKMEDRIQRLERELAAMTDAYENMRDFARANGLDTTAAPSGSSLPDVRHQCPKCGVFEGEPHSQPCVPDRHGGDTK